MAEEKTLMKPYSSPLYFHCITDPQLRNTVYEPEADTFLFLEALDKDLARHVHETAGATIHRCLEIGCGSGTVLTHAACTLLAAEREDRRAGVAPSDVSPPLLPSSWTNFVSVAVDVNPHALAATRLTWNNTMTTYFPTYLSAHGVVEPLDAVDLTTSFLNGSDNEGLVAKLQATPHNPPLQLCLVEGDLFTPFATAGASGLLFDLILFNPPYVPTSQEELDDAIRQKDIITAAWCGGPRGRVVLDRFLSALPLYLSPQGACYVVLIKENDIADVYATIEASFRQYGAQMGEGAAAKGAVSIECVAERYTGEHLSIHRITYAH